MPQLIGAGSNAAAGVQSSDSERAGPTVRQNGNKMAQAAKRLGAKVLQAIPCFCKPGTGAVGVQQPIESAAGSEHTGSLRNEFVNLVIANDPLVRQNMDPQRPFSETLQDDVQKAITSLTRLTKIVSESICSKSGAINLSFIEHYCGLRNLANAVSPDFLPQPEEGQTAILAHSKDFMHAVIDNEIQLIDSILKDIGQSGSFSTIGQPTRTALEKVSGILKASAGLMQSFSRKELLHVQRTNPDAICEAVDKCLEAVKKLPHGDQLLIPLAFTSLGAGKVESAGHATFLVVEKNSDSTVNLHMVNREKENGEHLVKPGEVVEDGQDPKIESAYSKWNVEIDQSGGLDFDFIGDTLMLTLDARVKPDFSGLVKTLHADPNQQMINNIAEFYSEFSKREGREAPPEYQPIYQRPQKDGNCAYSNLKASIRHLLRNPEIYNQIDILKTEKVAQLTSEHMEHMLHKLLQDPDPDTARLKRYCFVAQAAVDKLLAKHEKALGRI